MPHAPMGFSQEGIIRRPLSAQGQMTTVTAANHGQMRENSAIADRMKEVSPADGVVGLQEMLMAAWPRQMGMTILRAKPAIRSRGKSVRLRIAQLAESGLAGEIRKAHKRQIFTKRPMADYQEPTDTPLSQCPDAAAGAREAAVAEFHRHLGGIPGRYFDPLNLPRVRKALSKYLEKNPRLTNRLPAALCWLLIPEVETAIMEGRDPRALPAKPYSEWMRYRGIGPYVINRFIRPLGLLADPGMSNGSTEFACLSSRAYRLLSEVHGFRTQVEVVRAVLQGKSLHAPGYGPKTLTEVFDWLALPDSTAGLFRQATRLRARLREYQEVAGVAIARKLGAAISPLAADVRKLRRGEMILTPSDRPSS